MWEDQLWNDMKRMRKRMNHLFGFSDFSRRVVDEEPANYRHAWTEIDENENEYVLSVEMPGVNKEDIHLEVHDGNRLVIKAEKKQQIEKKDEETESVKKYSLIKKYSGFYRSFDLPEEADTSLIDAKYVEGILKITIPRKKSVKKKNMIKVR